MLVIAAVGCCSNIQAVLRSSLVVDYLKVIAAVFIMMPCLHDYLGLCWYLATWVGSGPLCTALGKQMPRVVNMGIMPALVAVTVVVWGYS